MKKHFLCLFFATILHFTTQAQCKCNDIGEIIAKCSYNNNNTSIALSWKTKNLSCPNGEFKIARKEINQSEYKPIKTTKGNEIQDDEIEKAKNYEYLIAYYIGTNVCVKKIILTGRAVDEAKFSEYDLNLENYKRLNVIKLTPLQKSVRVNASIQAKIEFLDINYPSFDDLHYVVIFGKRIEYTSEEIKNVDYSKPLFHIPFNATAHKTCRLAIVQGNNILGISEEVNLSE